MSERDMMYGGFYQGMPGNMQYGNFGYQGMPGSLMGTNMMPNMMMGGYQNPNYFEQGGTASNGMMDVNTRLNNLETRVRLLEQRLGTVNSESNKDDNSMYMI